MGGPDIDTINNQATPVAEDFVQHLQGLMDAGSLGQGVGPLQQGAGQAITNFVTSLEQGVAQGGIDPGTQALIDALGAESRVATNRQAADQREAFGAAGSRFGTTLANSEALLRAESARGLDATVGEILTRRQGQVENNLLNAIAQMSAQGSANLNPFLMLAQLGIAPAENVVSPGVGQQILSGGLNALGEFVGRGGSLPLPSPSPSPVPGPHPTPHPS